jgi:VWFA-related protein
MRLKSSAVFAFLSFSALAQNIDPPKFTGGGTTVIVDVVVTDKNNAVLKNLRPEDFLVFEDDTLQELTSFQAVQPEAVTVSSERLPGLEPDTQRFENREARPPNLIMMLLDYATTDYENQKLVREASVKWVRDNLRPDDLVAVFALGSSFESLQDFTDDREALIEALQRRDVSGRSMAATGGTGPKFSATDSEALIASGSSSISPGSAQEMQAQAAAMQAQGSQTGQLMSAERIQNLFYRMSSYLAEREARSVLRAIAAMARGVESVDGRKTLILFSQGFVVGGHMERDLEKTISIANLANVAVYAVDSQGLMPRGTSSELVPSGELSSISAATGPRRKYATGGESLFDRARQVGSDQRDSALRHVAAETGGFAIRNTNDLHVGLQRIDEDIRSYYLLTYQPINQTYDGQFRRIRVEVKREGVQVRARSGYRALPPGLQTVGTEEYQLLRDAEAGQVSLDLKTYLRLDAFLAPRQEQPVLVTLEIPTPEIRFEEHPEENGKRTARLEVLGLIRRAGGDVIERFGTPMNLHLTPEEHEVLNRGSLSFANHFDLLPGSYTVQVVTRDPFSNKVGLVESALQVAEPSRELALSTIVLGKDVERNSSDEFSFLTANGTRVLPLARRVFRNQDKLVFYFDIYNFRLSQLNSPEVAVTVSLSRSGSAQRLTLPELIIRDGQPGSSLSVAKYIELEGLAAGTYFLTANVVDRVAVKTIEARTSFAIQ